METTQQTDQSISTNSPSNAQTWTKKKPGQTLKPKGCNDKTRTPVSPSRENRAQLESMLGSTFPSEQPGAIEKQGWHEFTEAERRKHRVEHYNQKPGGTDPACNRQTAEPDLGHATPGLQELTTAKMKMRFQCPVLAPRPSQEVPSTQGDATHSPPSQLPSSAPSFLLSSHPTTTPSGLRVSAGWWSSPSTHVADSSHGGNHCQMVDRTMQQF